MNRDLIIIKVLMLLSWKPTSICPPGFYIPNSIHCTVYFVIYPNARFILLIFPWSSRIISGLVLTCGSACFVHYPDPQFILELNPWTHYMLPAVAGLQQTMRNRQNKCLQTSFSQGQATDVLLTVVELAPTSY